MDRCEHCGHHQHPIVLEVRNSRAVDQMLYDLLRRTERIELKGTRIMATVADLNTKLDELVKDVKRVLDIVTQDPKVGGATQAEVDALAVRLDALDTDVETASPETPPTP